MLLKSHARGQLLIYYFSSRCKAAWQAFEDNEDAWTESTEKHEWWTMGLRAEGVSFTYLLTVNVFIFLGLCRKDWHWLLAIISLWVAS